MHTYFEEDFYCKNCENQAIKRYNPFKIDFDHDEIDENDTIFSFTQTLSTCKPHQVSDINNSYSELIKDHMSVLFQNIDGVKSNFDALALSLKRFTQKFPIIALAETNIGPELASVYQIPDYTPKYQETMSGKSKGSGVAVYIHNSLNATDNCELSQCTKNLETYFVTLSSDNNMPTTVGVLYIPPSGSIKEALDELKIIIERAPKRSYIVCDFNIDLHGDNRSNIEKLEQILFAQGFYPTISTATHEKPGCKPSCIDNIITNDIESVITSGTIPNTITHHHQLFQIFESSTSKLHNRSKTTQYYDYCNSNVDKFVDHLSEEIGRTAIDSFGTFNKIFRENLDKTCKLEVPKCSKRTVQNNPLISSGIIASVNHCDKLYYDWRKSRKKKCKEGELDNRGGSCSCKICSHKRSCYTRYKDYRKILKRVRKEAKEKYFKGKFDEKSGDMKKTWEIINKIRGKDKRQIKPQFVIDNEKVTNRRVIANEFNKYFVSLASTLNNAYNELGEMNIANIPDFTDYLPKTNPSSIYLHDCSPEEIRDIILEFQNGKSSDIPIHVVKKACHTVSPIICALYNRCMKNGVFPDELKTGRISPIYKKDDKQLLENYRPVSTLPIFGKIFEKIIFARLYSFVTSKNLINENQYGFRKQHSTSHAINYSVTHIEKLMREKQHVLGIYIDLSKAFDTICHKKLLYKLNTYGIRGNAHSLIKSYLSNRKQYVSVLEECSEELTVQYGVPQGSVLGPLLFIMYINDICNSTKLGKFVLFADDTNIFVTDKSEKIVYSKANMILESVSQYMLCNLLHINIKKCCYMHFKPRSRNPDIIDNSLKLQLGPNIIKRVKETKFLGVTIDDKLSWQPHIKNLNSKLKCEIGKLNAIKNLIPQELYENLYHTLFESHLSFGITAWGGVSNLLIEPVFTTQKKCIRVLFGDREAYLDKFKTCARTRTYENRILGKEFYKREPTKPLFVKHNLLTVHSLYKYHCILEMFKVIKFHIPMPVYELFNRSKMSDDKLVSILPSIQFDYQASNLWIKCRKSRIDFTTSIGIVKSTLTKALLFAQSNYGPKWHNFNYDTDHFEF